MSQPEWKPQRPPDDDEGFDCDVTTDGDTVRVRPAGSLDMETAPLLDRRLDEARRAGFRRLIVDLSGLSFMDSTGLRLALRWNAAARDDGFDLGFVPGSA